MLKFHFASSAIFDPQRETNLYFLSCVTLAIQAIKLIQKVYK